MATREPLQSAIRIVRPEKEHLEALAWLHQTTMLETYRDHLPEEQAIRYVSEAFHQDRIAEELARPDVVFFLALVGTDAVAFSKLVLNAPCKFVDDPAPVQFAKNYVLRSHHGLGIGSQLLQARIDLARDRRFRSGWLTVWEGNAKAIEFHRRKGFQPVGTTEYRYIVDGEPRVDVDLVMLLRFVNDAL